MQGREPNCLTQCCAIKKGCLSGIGAIRLAERSHHRATPGSLSADWSCCSCRGQPAWRRHGRRQQELPLWVRPAGPDPGVKGHHQSHLVRTVVFVSFLLFSSARRSSLSHRLFANIKLWSHSAFYSHYFLFIYFETEQRLKFESIDGYIHQMMSSGFHE